jgi:hypothetical protein
VISNERDQAGRLTQPSDSYERRLRMCEADCYTAELDLAKGARAELQRITSAGN